VVVVDDEVEQVYVDRSWRDRGPFTYPAQTATGTVPVPAHRYEREVGGQQAPEE